MTVCSVLGHFMCKGTGRVFLAGCLVFTTTALAYGAETQKPPEETPVVSDMRGQAVNLVDVYTLAEANDPTLRAVEFKKLAIDEGHRQAVAELLPTVSGTAGYSYIFQDIKQSDNDVYEAGEEDYGTFTYGARLTQPVFRWDLYVGLNQAETKKLLAAADYVLAQQDLMVRTAETYLNALSAKDQLRQALIEQKAVTKHLELAKDQLDMGISPITDYYDAMARAATNQAVVIEAENIYSDALQALMELTGKQIDTLVPLLDTLPLTSPDPDNVGSWIGGALENNPGVEMKRRAVEIAEQEVSRQRAAFYPYADLVGEYENEDADGSLYGGGSEVESFEVSVQLTIPIYEGGMRFSRMEEATYTMNSARQELIKEQREVERGTRSAFLGVQTALSQIEALKQSVRSNELALDAKQEGFLSGLQSTLNVLDAERDLSLVNINYAKARYRYVLNTLRLKQATGSLSVDDVTDLGQWFGE